MTCMISYTHTALHCDHQNTSGVHDPCELLAAKQPPTILLIMYTQENYNRSSDICVYVWLAYAQ